MERIMELLVANSAAMSLLIICFLILTPRLLNRYHAKWIYYSWLFLVIGLVIPFRIHFQIMFERPSSEPIFIYNYYQGNDQDMYLREGKETESESLPSHQIIGSVWLIGFISFILCQGRKHYRFTKLLRRWGEEDKASAEYKQLQKLSCDMGISKPVRLRISPCISSPMQIGFVKPVLVLPAMDLSDEELSLILRHELIHFMRKDLWYKGLVLIATAINWFNPLVYLMGKAIGEQCELSCDYEVVKGSDTEKKIRYCETIIGMMQGLSKAEPVFSANLSNGRKGIMKRIHSIMDGSEKKAGAVILGMALFGIILTGVDFNTTTVQTVIAVTTDITTEIIEAGEDEEIGVSSESSYYLDRQMK